MRRRSVKAISVGALLFWTVGCVPLWAAHRDDPAPPLHRLAAAVHQRANGVRASRGLPPLDWQGSLAGVADRHSRDMADRAYFDHRSPEGETPADRARQRGVDCRAPTADGRTRVGVAENLFLSARYHSYQTFPGGARQYRWLATDRIAARAVATWMESPGHRANLLDPVSSGQGVGVAVSVDHRVYITAVLC